MDKTDLTHRISDLSPAKRALLAKKLKEKSLEFPVAQTIARRTIEKSIPLSFAQERLWFLNQLDPESSAYNESTPFRISGPLNINALTRALNAIIARHEALRTTIVNVDGTPSQRIATNRELEVPVIDLRSWPEDSREIEAQRLITESFRRPFDLSRDLMVRVLLVRLAEEEYIFVAAKHHIASDGWSSRIFRRELVSLYEAFSKGETPILPELPIQYADYAVWQRDWLQGDNLEAQLSYWRKQLADLPVLKLPTDRPRPTVQSYGGARHSFDLSDDLSNRLKILSRQENVTLFMTLLAAFQTLLYRYTGQDDISVGTPIAGRTRPETEGLIGFFVNTLVMRTDLSGNPTFRDLLTRVRKVALEAYDNQDIPFEKLVQEINPDRSLSHTPLFQVMFAYQNLLQHDFQVPGLTVTRIDLGNYEAKFGLSLGMVDGPKGLQQSIEYDTEIFDTATITRLSSHYQTLLESIVADPNQKLSELPLLLPAERHQLLVEWNDTKADYPADKTIHQLFEEQAEKTPEAIAVKFNDQKLSYGELNKRANQLGHYLRKLGVNQNSLVAISMERSIDMTVGLLGILKAGAAYVPLDPSDPTERLVFILHDTKASVLLTQERLQKENRARIHDNYGETPRGDSAVVVCLDSDWIHIGQESQEDIETESTADALAYVIYTSGSTGQPKGVMVSHQALVTHTLSVVEHYELGSSDRVLQFASLSFDVAAEEIFPAWLSGAPVVLLPERVPTIADFVDYLIKQGITLVNLPSAYWHLWVDGLDRLEKKLPPSLRLLIVGNEKVSLDHFKRWHQAFDSKVRWLNAYGPTEATVTATVYEAPQGDQNYRDLASVPIGRPLTNRQIYILDPYLQPAPIGVTGEIYIGGPALALGYLNNSELTAEKFISNPFCSDSSARLYRTGDLARYLSNGNIEFLGRSDGQIKIRGFRIELGEIENQLLSHPDIRATAVSAREDVSGEIRLVAYVVPRSASVSDVVESSGDDTRVESEIRRVELWPSVGEYPIYDELLYHAMTSDRARLAKYQSAIEKFVKDKTVLDVGTGKDAILARICADAGAKKVYAVEVMDTSYEQAKILLQKLRLEDKIQLVKGELTKIELSEKVDVCVSEIFGTIGGSEGAAVVLTEARRFLHSDGLMIPKCCITKIAAISLPDELHQLPGFTEVPAFYAEKVFEQVGHKFDFRVCIKNFPQSNILSDVSVFESLNFHELVSTTFSNEVALTIMKSGRLDGFLLWIYLETADGVFLETLQEQFNWLPVFFPVCYPGADVIRGDRIEMTCSGTISDNGINPDYRVTGKVIRQNGASTEFDFFSPHHKQVYKQTEFYRRLFEQDKVARVTAVNSKIAVPSLTHYLKRHLPDYMIPSAFVFLNDLPLTANGKVDHKALPDPQNQATQNHHQYVAPRDETETILCKLWGEILKLDRVGIDDDFFAIGGHSLLAAKLFSRLDEHFGRSLPLGVLFAAPTVRALAELYKEPAKQRFPELVALREAGTLPPVFAVPGVFGNVVCFADLCRELGPEQPFYGLQSVGLDGSLPPLSSIDAMASLYIDEIRSVQPQGPYALLGACVGATIAYEMARQLLDDGEEVAFLGLLDPARSRGKDPTDSQWFKLQGFKRAAAVGSLVSTRWYLYIEEMRPLKSIARFNYLARKLRTLAGLFQQPGRLRSTMREINQIEVYRANLAALNHYQQRSLIGKLRAVEIFHTARRGSRRDTDPFNWDTLWSGSTVKHLVPGKDSGDMLSENNVKILAPLLAKRLSAALPALNNATVTQNTANYSFDTANG